MNNIFKNLILFSDAVKKSGVSLEDKTEKILKEIDFELEKKDLKDLYIVTYRSKPIKGIVLELMTLNPDYTSYKHTSWGRTEER